MSGDIEEFRRKVVKVVIKGEEFDIDPQTIAKIETDEIKRLCKDFVDRPNYEVIRLARIAQAEGALSMYMMVYYPEKWELYAQMVFYVMQQEVTWKNLNQSSRDTGVLSNNESLLQKISKNSQEK